MYLLLYMFIMYWFLVTDTATRKTNIKNIHSSSNFVFKNNSFPGVMGVAKRFLRPKIP